MDDTTACLICFGIFIAIIWIMVHWVSFVIVLVTGVILLFSYEYIETKKEEREKERKEAKKRRSEKERRKKEAERKKFEEGQMKKGLIEYKNKWGTPKQVKKWKEIDIGLSNNFANYNPYEFEKFIAKLFKKMGYDTKRTPSTGDFGADVIAKKDGGTVLIEVKKYSKGHNVTPKEVQRALGAIWKHKADKAVFITTSDFTVRAKEVQDDGPIELWNKKTLEKMLRKYFIIND